MSRPRVCTHHPHRTQPTTATENLNCHTTSTVCKEFTPANSAHEDCAELTAVCNRKFKLSSMHHNVNPPNCGKQPKTTSEQPRHLNPMEYRKFRGDTPRPLQGGEFPVLSTVWDGQQHVAVLLPQSQLTATSEQEERPNLLEQAQCVPLNSPWKLWLQFCTLLCADLPGCPRIGKPNHPNHSGQPRV